MVYQGNCHCGSYRFEVDAADEEGLRQLLQTCACVGCTKLGSILLTVNADQWKTTRDDGKLCRYATTTTTGIGMEHRFCSTCGTSVSAMHKEGPLAGKQTVNLRCLQGVNPFVFDPVKTATTDGPLPSKGSCLCGEVTVELLSPLQEMEIKEDNCSVCSRNAWLGAYPSRAQVAIQGQEHTRDYTFGRGFTGHPFCGTCGTHVYMNVYGPPQQMIEKLPLDKQAMVRRKLDVAPVMVRVLEGIDLGRVKTKRSDEGTEGYVLGS